VHKPNPKQKRLVLRAFAVALTLAPAVVAGSVTVNPDSVNPFGRSWSSPSTQPGADRSAPGAASW
jgi:hypothetical protein